MKRITALLNVLWLPLFLMLSMTWLFAPALHGARYETLAVISHYEAVDQSFNWLFRLCDILAGTLLVACILRFHILLKQRALGAMLLVFASFIAVDSIFPVGCIQSCGVLDTASTIIHDTESVIGSLLLAAATILQMRKHPHWVNTAFLCAQLVCGLVAISGLATHQVLVIVEFIYESLSLVWVAWAVKQFAPPITLREKAQEVVRQLAGVGILVIGILTITLALPHHHAFDFLSGLTFDAGQPWLVQHGIIVGVALLYLSRHVRKGQRRAAIMLVAILVTQVLRYALFQPRPTLLAINVLLLILIWWGRSAFNRNVEQLPLTSRLHDIAIVFAGVVVAIGVVVGAATLTHRQDRLYHSIDRTFIHGESGLHRRESHVTERYERPVRLAFETLAISLAAVVLWGIFRPSRTIIALTEDDYSRAKHLLEKYSNSSEDYFKLWPHDKSYFFNARRSGFVAYKVAGSVAFALADPVAPNNQRRQMIREFTDFCRSRGWTACFLLIQADSKHLYSSKLRTLNIGSSAVIDVKIFVEETMHEKWWRWQHNRAQKSGFVYDVSLPPHDVEILQEAELVSSAWLERAGHSEQGFALGYFDKEYLRHCRLHLLRDAAGQLVAFSNELPVFGTLSRRTVDLIRFLPDIDGAMPVLIMHLMNRLYQSGNVTSFDLGFVPLAKVDSTIAALARRLTQSRFSAAGLEQFKSKFRPDWQPNYVAYDGERTDVVDMAIILSKLDNALSVDLSDHPPE